MKQTIGEKYRKPNPNCTQCRGSGWVQENHPWGNTTASEDVGCYCAESAIQICAIGVEWICQKCRGYNRSYVGTDKYPECSNCHESHYWESIAPQIVLDLIGEINKFLDGQFDHKTEAEMAQDISERLWVET